MKYKVEMLDSDFDIEFKHQKEVLEIWKNLNNPEYNHLKKGGAYENGEKISHWYFKMPENYDREVKSVEDILKLIGYEFDYNKKADINITGYSGQIGQQDIFLQSISHLMKEGSFILWELEDNSEMAWVIIDQKMVEIPSNQLDQTLNKIKQKENISNQLKDNNHQKTFKYKI